MATKFRKGMVQLASVTATVLLAVGVIGTEQAVAQVNLTKHNLSANQTAYDSADGTTSAQGARRNFTSATQQVCVFCHTPHGAQNDKAPLWQREVKADTFYKTYSSTAATTKSPTMDADTSQAIGSVSVACLSCHDGTQAINMLANAPGSGGLVPGSLTEVTGFNASSTSMSADKKLINAWNLGGDGSDGVAAGADLRNDHPIGIAYSGGVTGSGTGKTTLTDKAFRPVTLTQVNSKDVWYVDVAGTGSGSRDKNDIALFTRDLGGSVGTQPFVECSSCHDPHLNAELFLRQPAANSAICLSCHIK